MSDTKDAADIAADYIEGLLDIADSQHIFFCIIKQSCHVFLILIGALDRLGADINDFTQDEFFPH